jgi:aminoglycoside phosphotransferase (APT) family kinase protein
VPPPAPAPPPAPRLAPAQRLQAVLAQLHETPVQRFSSVPFSKREAARTTASANAAASAYRSAAVRTVKTAITSNTALALLQAAPMNLYAYRAPTPAQSYFGINRFI